ncbi:hypothetical protein [Acinetobacter bereziniae]|uniref:hypothetical protein n=1 Tax=Acinetobacter bereziniae TaxID=106648 RepID=UPI00066735A1|nr:hypothetical protein [Acinetobacter bereziniae]
MNAVEFVRKFGWVKAVEAIKNAPPLDDKVWYFFWCNECGNGGSSQTMNTDSYMSDYCACSVCTSEDLKSDDGVYEELKSLVESWEMVGSYGGLVNAKIEVKYIDLDWDFKSPRQLRLEQAIADVESVGGGV